MRRRAWVDQDWSQSSRWWYPGRRSEGFTRLGCRTARSWGMRSQSRLRDDNRRRYCHGRACESDQRQRGSGHGLWFGDVKLPCMVHEGLFL